jgi:hypothetical protein
MRERSPRGSVRGSRSGGGRGGEGAMSPRRSPRSPRTERTSNSPGERGGNRQEKEDEEEQQQRWEELELGRLEGEIDALRAEFESDRKVAKGFVEAERKVHFPLLTPRRREVWRRGRAEAIARTLPRPKSEQVFALLAPSIVASISVLGPSWVDTSWVGGGVGGAGGGLQGAQV